MSSRGKTNVHDNIDDGVRVFRVFSRELAEYYASVKDDDFSATVEVCLDSSGIQTSGNKSRTGKAKYGRVHIDSKFHIAGGSSRYMFSYVTNAVVDDLRGAMENADGSYVDYIKGNVGTTTSGVINRLISVFRPSRPRCDQDTVKPLLSSWLARAIALLSSVVQSKKIIRLK